ncbi:MAG: protease-like factor [Chlamydiales bacterium]|jgi:hypothetical protein|nr:protease-like factor [Chlamydiales bacterium]
MKKIIKAFSPVFLSLAAHLLPLTPLTAKELPPFDSKLQNLQLKEKMLSELDFIKSMVKTTYAPAKWKQTYFQWTIDEAIDQAKEQVLLSKVIGIKDFHQILRFLFNSMRDYHVGVHFIATEKASLPLTIKGHQGRYYITSIDRSKLKEKQYPFQIGDEVISFDGKPIAEAIAQIKGDLMQASPLTDQSLAEIALTKRRAKAGDSVPSGSLDLTIKTDGKLQSHSLYWEYKEEVMDDGTWKKGAFSKKEQCIHLFQKQCRLSKENAEELYNFLKHPMIYAPMAFDLLKGTQPNLIGHQESFVPQLGRLIWKAAHQKINAYIFQTEELALVGYLRIPSYAQFKGAYESQLFGDDVSLADLAQVIAHLEEHTDALVVDQVNNPGGLLPEAYTIAALLSDQPLKTLSEHIQLSANLIRELHSLLEYMEQGSGVEELIVELIFDPLEIDSQMVSRFKMFCHWIIEEWQQGVKYTQPCYIFGIEKINPHPVHYSKPLLMLINELDFSCADLVPAILQDNKRATLIGVKTAGAGGAVNAVSYPNGFAIDSFTTTWTLLKRLNDEPLENLGVTPDIELQINEEDLTHNYAHYKREVLTAVKALLKK